MNQNYNFISAPTKKALLRLFLPMMAGMILNFAYNIVDSLWVGNLLGDEALAALTSATPIVTLMFSFGMGVTNGMGILLSKQLAKNDKKEEEQIISSTLFITFGLSVILVAVIELFLDKILLLVNTDTATFQAASDYLTVYLVGMIPSYIFCHITAMLRCYGDSIFQMVSMLITSCINAVLDPILIKMIGFHGAAIATVFSQMISLLLIVLYCRKKAYFHLKFRSQPNKYFVSVVKLSVPTVIQQCTPSLSSVVLTACVSKFGIAAMAGYGIVNKLDMILFMPAMCLNMALTPIIGYCVGGKREDRASDYLKLSIRFSAAAVIVCGVFLLLFAKPVAGMFGCSAEVAALVQHCISFLVWGYLLNAVTQCFMGRINGYGKPEKGMIITVVNHIVIRIPFSILLSETALGLDGIWVTLLFSFVAAFVCAYRINQYITRKH